MLYFTRILRIKDSKKYEQQLDTLEINLLNGQLTIGNNGNPQILFLQMSSKFLQKFHEYDQKL